MADIEKTEMLSMEEQLNLETAQIPWVELQRLYARGVIMVVSSEMDLVKTASQIVEDHIDLVKGWIESGNLRRATDDDARTWHENNTSLWAVTAAPWVLVQLG